MRPSWNSQVELKLNPGIKYQLSWKTFVPWDSSRILVYFLVGTILRKQHFSYLLPSTMTSYAKTPTPAKNKSIPNLTLPSDAIPDLTLLRFPPKAIFRK